MSLARPSTPTFLFRMNLSFIALLLALVLPQNVLNQERRPLQGQSNTALASAKCPADLAPRKRLVCYYRIEDDFRPYDLDPCICTHIVYSYVAVKENFAFIAGKKGDLKYLSALRSRNPSVKIIVSLRPTGSAFTLEDPKNITYPLPPSNTLRHRFAKRIRDFLTRHSLDGIDLDYEYFKQESHSNNRRREYLISIIQSISSSLKLASDAIKPLLTITTSRYPRHLADYYDFSELHKYIDFVNVPAFNFDQDGNTLIHPSKLHGISEMENMDAIMDLAFALGLPPHQLVVGIPTFGTLYRLANTSQTTPGSASISWSANKQPITTISHSKICDVRQKANWTLVREKDLTAPYIHLHDKWIGFDDEISVKLKAKYIVLRQAGGLAFFHLNEDDPTGQCGLGAYPLVQSALSVFNQPIENINTKPIVSPLFTNATANFFMSFLDVVAKHGNIERVVEDDEEGTILPCTHPGYMRHTEDCTRFYRCLKFSPGDSETQKFQYNCPAGLVFDETYQICNWPSWSPSCIGSGEISPSSKQSFVCSRPGYFQDPDNCENFYYCSDLGKSYLQSYEFKCPFELGFDEEKLQCNWKWLVKGCGYVPPEERIVKDLQQILPQAGGAEFADQLDITPAASDVSQLFEHMNTEDFIEGEPEDEFEERSDDVDEAQGRSLPGKLGNLAFLRINKLDSGGSDDTKPGGLRLQQLSSYVSKLVSRVRNTFLPASTLESRSDRLNSGSWLNPFNHLKMPKFKPFSRKPKAMTTRKPKTAKLKRVKSKSKNPFKMGKLPKFGKDKKKASSPTPTSSSIAPNYPAAGMHEFMPMFVEETVHVPTIVKPPSNFAFAQFPISNMGKPLHTMATAESSMQPVAFKVSPPRNHFNSGPGQMHVNVLNDYQVAGSFAVNTFGDPHQSTAPTKAPTHLSASFFYPTSAKPAVHQHHRKPSIAASSVDNTAAGSSLLSDPFRPYRHSYGLPSVNIRYSYDKPQSKPVTSAPVVRVPVPVPQPKTTNKVVKIETTKFNFPGPGEIANEDNSADEQLENFLRDKFIHQLQPGARPSSASGTQPKAQNAFRQRPQVTTTTSKPRTLVKLQMATRKPAAPQVQPHVQLTHSRLAASVGTGRQKPQNVVPQPNNNKFTNHFSTFTSGVDPFANEREKFFGNFNPQPVQREPASPPPPPPPKPSQPKLASLGAPAKPAVNYKLTPIDDAVFEISSTQRPPVTRPVAAARDPISHAVHKANRFEYIRSTQRPAIKYESYEWTTPTSLRNDKVKVNFNVMSPKDITEEINSKKHLFSEDSYKPLDTPPSKPEFFPPIGDVFRHYQPQVPTRKPTPAWERPTLETFEATPDPVLHELASSPDDEDLPSTTASPWPVMDEHNLAKLANDTNEYIMLMLSKQMGAQEDKAYEANLRDLLENSKNLAKVYNVESDAGQTLLALLPKFVNDGTRDTANKPFVYKGETSLLRNLSHGDSVDSNVFKLDISKPDSDLLHSIFDRVKDQFGGTDQVLPTEEEIFGIQSHQARRIPPGGGNLIAPQRPVPTSTLRPSTRESTSNIFNQPASTSSTSQPWYEHFDSQGNPVRDSYPGDTVYEFQGDNQSNNQKLNRSSNAWYEDVSKGLRLPPNLEVDTVPPSSESPSTARPTVASSQPRRFTKPSTTTSSTTTTTTTTTTSSPTTTEASTTAKPAKITRRPQLRRKQEYGSRQGAGAKAAAENEAVREAKPQQQQPVPVSRGDHTPTRTSSKPETADYANQNNFGQKLSANGVRGKDSFAEVSSTEKPIFYEEELPEFTELNYPETQNNHHPSSTRRVMMTTTTASPVESEREPARDNTYYPDSAVHNLKADKTGIPESACSRPGIFQHPNDCNRYYECYWDKKINKFSLQPFECPVKLAFDSRIIGCASPNDPTVCVQY